jgi:hypothetical protein
MPVFSRQSAMPMLRCRRHDATAFSLRAYIDAMMPLFFS